MGTQYALEYAPNTTLLLSSKDTDHILQMTLEAFHT